MDQHGQLWMRLVCAKFVLQLHADSRRECWNSCKWTVWKVSAGWQLLRQGCYRKWKLGICLILKPNSSHPNDTPHNPLCQRSIRLLSWTWKSCWLHFLLVKASLIMSLCLEGNCEFCMLCWDTVMLMGQSEKEFDQENWVMDVPCTMTTPQVTQLYQCISFWWKDISREDPLYSYMVGIRKPHS